MPAPFPRNPYRAAQSERLKALLQGNYAQSPEEQSRELTGNAIQYPQFIQNIGSAASNFFNPIEAETGYPNIDIAGPVMVGPTGARNAQKILQELQTLNQHGTGWETLASNATEFLKRKYPTIYKKIKAVGGNFGVADRDVPENLGAYFGSEKKPVIFDKGTSRRLSEYINTGAHELGHFVRHARGKLDELVEAGKFGWVDDLKTGGNRLIEGSYHQPALSPEVASTIKDPDALKARQIIQEIKYYDQPAEVAARQAGLTGEMAYENFIDRIFPDPEDPIYVEDVMEKLGIPAVNRYKFTPPRVK